MDLLSGSNCCNGYGFHLFRGRDDGSFGDMENIRFQRTEIDPTGFLGIAGRGITRPRVFDWNRDGKDDLVMGMREIQVDRNLRSFDVDACLQTVEKEKQDDITRNYDAQNYLRTTNVEIPEFNRLRVLGQATLRAWPVHVEFADWDGDGTFDLLAIIESHVFSHRSNSRVDSEQENHPEASSVQGWEPRHTIFWLRNKTSTGEPEFEAALPLYQVRGNIKLQSFTVIDWDDDGTNEIVVSVSNSDPKNTLKVFDKQLQLLANP